MSNPFDMFTTVQKSLKIDIMSQWIETEWMPKYGGEDWLTLWIPNDCLEESVINRFDRNLVLPDGWRFVEGVPFDCPILTRVHQYNHEGAITFRSGAFLYRFKRIIIDGEDKNENNENNKNNDSGGRT